jgi:nitrite reductase/ring-hydroxylating ferredoxin subunit
MTGAYLALVGVGTALVAAIPGFIDYFFTVPPHSTAKARATKHMLLNLSAVSLFAVAWGLRGEAGARPEMPQLFLEAAAAALLTMGGWMGGTLAFRNQIGVDHRYAKAGKWAEEYVTPDSDAFAIAGRSGELEVNQMKLLHVNGRRIVLARTADGYFAFSDRCTHRGGSLAGGTMICGTVQCPWHGSQFDVASGAVKAGPAEEGIETFRVEKKGEKFRVSVT